MVRDDVQHATELLGRLGRLMTADGHVARLRPAQWEALRYLARANRFSRSPGALAAYLRSTKGTVSQTLMALERKNLIAKRADARDRRHVFLELTGDGERILADDPLARMAAAISRLAEGARARLVTELEALIRSRLAVDGGRPFGLCRECRHFRRDDPDGAPHRCALLSEPLGAGDAGRICVEQQAAAAG